MGLLSVLVKHQRQDWRATEVIIEGNLYEEDARTLVARAREHLRVTDYATYLFVTENPEPPPHDSGWIGSMTADGWVYIREEADAPPQTNKARRRAKPSYRRRHQKVN